MPKKPATLHPILWRAVEETVGSWGNLGSVGSEGEAKRQITRYWALRQGKVSLPFAGGCLGGFMLFIAGVILIGTSSAAFGLTAWVGSLSVLSLTAARLMAVRHATVEEIATVLPILDLTPTQRSAFEAWLTLEGSDLPEETKAELRAGLGGLVDEEVRLRNAGTRRVGTATRPATIEAERDALRARLTGTTDAAAREALEQGLRTAERRLDAARNDSAVTERIDAQQEMIAQAAGDVRDALLRLEAAPSSGAGTVETASVREALAHVQAHAAALEAAVAEVRALDARG